ncbi:MAG: ATP-binding protein [Anaerovoracaceae bacterium]
MRCSFICTKINGEYYIKNCHWSVSSEKYEGNKDFPFRDSNEKLQARLSNANKELQTLIDGLPGGIIRYSVETGKIAYVSNNLLLSLGYTEDEFLEKCEYSFYNLVSPSDSEEIKEKIKSLKINDSEFFSDMEIVNQKGEKRWFYSKSKLTIVAEGKSWIYAILVDATAKKESEMENEQSITSLMAAAKHAKLYYWDYDIKNHNSWQSEFARERLNVETYLENYPKDLIQKSIVAEESRETFIQIHEKLDKGIDGVSGDIRIHRADGESEWVNVKYVLMYDKDGNPTKAIGTAINIDERKSMEEEYKALVTYKNVVSKNLVAFIRLDLTENKFIDSEGVDNIALPSEDTGCITVDDFFDQVYEGNCEFACLLEYRKLFNRQNLLENYRNENKAIDFEHRTKLNNGKFIWVKSQVQMIENPYNGNIEALLHVTDIHDRKTTETLVLEITKRNYDYIITVDAVNDYFKMYTDNINVGSMIPTEGKYSEGVEIHCSHCENEETKNITAYEMSIPNIISQLETKDSFTIKTVIIDSHGNRRIKKIEVFYIDKVRKIVCICRMDVTDFIITEEQRNIALTSALIAAKQANAAKLDFLSRMSHEIRTPMNAIIGMAAIARQSKIEDANVLECLSKIEVSSKFLLSLINDILDMGRIESGKILIQKEKFSLFDLLIYVNGIGYSQAKLKEIEYECIIDANLQENYIGDFLKIQQIIVNVVSNAIKFTDKEGKVTLDVECVNRNRGHDKIKITVSDTGCGIRKEFIDKIFEPFEQQSSDTILQYGGTGLGLTICKTLVDLMGGKITVDSIEGIGSQFAIELELEQTEENKTSKIQRGSYDFSNIKTLVVDDDISVCEYIAAMLDDMCIKNKWATSGKEAIEIVKNARTDDEDFDFILLDWKMPGMSGVEVAVEIRKIVGADVTIIIITSY